ncbi:MAG TPA: hypothetical protein VF278_12500 [Pirellulales bacterium]
MAIGGSINAGTVPSGFAPTSACPGDAGEVAFGNAANGGTIAAGGDGALAHGDADGANALIIAVGDGTHAEGKADQDGAILAQADGAQACGAAEATADPNVKGVLQSTGKGACAQGSVNSGTLTASGEGAHAEGSAENQAGITFSNTGSHAEGSAADSATIESTNEGSHAEGSAESTSQAGVSRIFWPDYGHIEESRLMWEAAEVSYRDEPEIESGQIVLDNARCWRSLNLAMHYNEHSTDRDWPSWYFIKP